MNILDSIPSAVDTAIGVADRLKAKIEVRYQHATPGKRQSFLLFNKGEHDAENIVLTTDVDHRLNFHPCDGRAEYRLPILYAGESETVQFLPCFDHDIREIPLSVSYKDGLGTHTRTFSIQL